VLTPEEVARLLEAAPGPGLKYKAALSVAYGAGLRGGEVVMLRVGDIDSERMLIPKSRWARAVRTAMPCSRRSCWRSCAPGGDNAGRALIALRRGEIPCARRLVRIVGQRKPHT
jgi:integrase